MEQGKRPPVVTTMNAALRRLQEPAGSQPLATRRQRSLLDLVEEPGQGRDRPVGNPLSPTQRRDMGLLGLVEVEEVAANEVEEEVARRPSLEKALHDFPRFIIVVDGTTSMRLDERIKADEIVRDLIGAIYGDSGKEQDVDNRFFEIGVFGDLTQANVEKLYRYESHVKTGLQTVISGGGNGCESSSEAVTEALRLIGVALTGISNLSEKERAGRVIRGTPTAYVITDEFPHAKREIIQGDLIRLKKMADHEFVASPAVKRHLQAIVDEYNSYNEEGQGYYDLVEWVEALAEAGVRLIVYSPKTNKDDYRIEHLGELWKIIAKAVSPDSEWRDLNEAQQKIDSDGDVLATHAGHVSAALDEIAEEELPRLQTQANRLLLLTSDRSATARSPGTSVIRL